MGMQGGSPRRARAPRKFKKMPRNALIRLRAVSPSSRYVLNGLRPCPRSWEMAPDDYTSNTSIRTTLDHEGWSPWVSSPNLVDSKPEYADFAYFNGNISAGACCIMGGAIYGPYYAYRSPPNLPRRPRLHHGAIPLLGSPMGPWRECGQMR